MARAFEASSTNRGPRPGMVYLRKGIRGGRGPGYYGVDAETLAERRRQDATKSAEEYAALQSLVARKRWATAIHGTRRDLALARVAAAIRAEPDLVDPVTQFPPDPATAVLVGRSYQNAVGIGSSLRSLGVPHRFQNQASRTPLSDRAVFLGLRATRADAGATLSDDRSILALREAAYLSGLRAGVAAEFLDSVIHARRHRTRDARAWLAAAAPPPELAEWLRREPGERAQAALAAPDLRAHLARGASVETLTGWRRSALAAVDASKRAANATRPRPRGAPAGDAELARALAEGRE